MTKKPDDPALPATTPRPDTRGNPGDARRDFYYDELMTPQPDALREYHRARLLKPEKPPAKTKP